MDINLITSKIKLNPYQADFLIAKARFPALIAAIGTGKTFMLLLKCMRHLETNPKALALIVRKEYTDLRDSTIQDFQRYFGVTINSSDKSYENENGAKVLFRHGDTNDLNVLKNLNLSFIGIEQAEEYESDEVFDFLRDRLRREGVDRRQFCIIANARGHNWIWRRWINNPSSEEYNASTANTFDNEHNLPKDFIADLKAMETEAPNHYKQYVLNSFEDVEQDDLLFTYQDIKAAIGFDVIRRGSYGARVIGVDVARYGQDKSVAMVLKQLGPEHWEIEHVESWHSAGGNETIGRILELIHRFNPEATVIDADGLGGPIFDMLNERNPNMLAFHNTQIGSKDYERVGHYGNMRTKYCFKIKDKMANRTLRLFECQPLIEEMQTIKFEYMSDRTRRVQSKENMRKDGLRSPDHVDALAYALYGTDNLHGIEQETFKAQPRAYAMADVI